MAVPEGRIIVKAKYKNKIKKFFLRDDISYDEFCMMLKSYFDLTVHTLDMICIEYLDDECDWILIRNEEDLVFSLSGNSRLYVRINDESVPEDEGRVLFSCEKLPSVQKVELIGDNLKGLSLTTHPPIMGAATSVVETEETQKHKCFPHPNYPEQGHGFMKRDAPSHPSDNILHHQSQEAAFGNDQSAQLGRTSLQQPGFSLTSEPSLDAQLGTMDHSQGNISYPSNKTTPQEADVLRLSNTTGGSASHQQSISGGPKFVMQGQGMLTRPSSQGQGMPMGPPSLGQGMLMGPPSQGQRLPINLSSQGQGMRMGPPSQGQGMPTGYPPQGQRMPPNPSFVQGAPMGPPPQNMGATLPPRSQGMSAGPPSHSLVSRPFHGPGIETAPLSSFKPVPPPMGMPPYNAASGPPTSSQTFQQTQWNRFPPQG